MWPGYCATMPPIARPGKTAPLAAISLVPRPRRHRQSLLNCGREEENPEECSSHRSWLFMRLFFTHTPLGQRSLGSLPGGIPQPPIASRAVAIKNLSASFVCHRAVFHIILVIYSCGTIKNWIICLMSNCAFFPRSLKCNLVRQRGKSNLDKNYRQLFWKIYHLLTINRNILLMS